MTEGKVWRRGLPFSAGVAPFVRHMPLVDEHRESLLRLQGVWDSLALLGQMSGTAADLSTTRSAFEALTARLLDSLATRLLERRRQALQARAQVAIDILVRNLFERTADVGFLAADAPLQALAAAGDQAGAAQRDALHARFRAYVAKYTVYDDIVVLSPQGQVLARLDSSVAQKECRDALVAEAMRPGAAYVEHYGATELLGGRQSLIYAHAVAGQGGPAGVLCLSFRLDDEMRALFRQLLEPGDHTVLALLDAQGRVVASSDCWQLPAGAQLELAAMAANQGRIAFAGREYLAMAAQASGYEGYRGPGWSAIALLPIEQAFDLDDGGEADVGSALADSLDTSELFDAELRGIPLEAQRIQSELTRSLWNGKLDRRAAASTGGFAAILLDEVESTGSRLRQVFEQAIGNLHHAALAALRDEAVFHAGLAINLVDRNLYERANDCRWWALDRSLQQVLAGAPADAAAARLRHVNSLYTVYSLLLLFDRQGRVVAVSDPARRDEWVGQVLEPDWVAQTLALRDRERYAVSRHEPSALYGGRSSYVFAAALPAPDDEAGAAQGGIALVFDGEPQFAAMLRDALPPGRRASALLLTRSGRVVSSSDPRWPAGSQGPVGSAALDLDAGASACLELEIDGLVHAAGVAMSAGYREYGRGRARGEEDLAAVVLMPLGPRLDRDAQAPARFEPPQAVAAAGNDTALEIAGFLLDGQWLGLPARQTLQAQSGARIAGLPAAAGSALVGMLEFQGRMLPVLDLGQLLFGRACSAGDAPVLVCESGDGRRLALRVQELGPVFVTPASALRTSPGRVGGEMLRLLGGAVPGSLMTLLDVDELWRRVGPAAEPAADLGLIEA